MEVAGQSFSKSGREELREIVHATVDGGAGYRKEHEGEDAAHKHLQVQLNDTLHDLPIDIGQPDTQVGTHNQQTREHYDVQDLLSLPAGNDDFEQLLDSFPENAINVAFTAL